LFSHPDARVHEGAALLTRAVAAAGPAAAAPMRDAALQEGALLAALAAAAADPGGRTGEGALARDLVALWCDGHPPALALLRRCLPPGLARWLDAPPPPPPVPALMRSEELRPLLPASDIRSSLHGQGGWRAAGRQGWQHGHGARHGSVDTGARTR
jgi:hypothetical protein